MLTMLVLGALVKFVIQGRFTPWTMEDGLLS